MGQSMTVTASMFGGPGDPGTGSTGYRGDNLNAKPDSFAELSNNPGAGVHGDFSALGNLPYGTPVTVTNPANGKSITVYKRDVGAGGSGLNGTKRGIDLWYKAAQQIGLNGLGVVNISIGGQGAGAKTGAATGGPGAKSVAQQRASRTGGTTGVGGSPKTTSTTTTTNSSSTTGGQVDWGAAGAAALMSEANRKIDTSGKLPHSDLLGKMISEGNSGYFTSPTVVDNSQKVATVIREIAQGKSVNQAIQDSGLNSSTGAANVSHGSSGLAAHIGGGNVNPLPAGWSIGRTDQGVDANAKPGTPIRAINDSVVKEIVPGWYAGQPLVLMQLTAGPDKGKYWYVSEQINHNLHAGQVIPRNAVVATYANSGTGIEIGWGSPNSGGRTLAQATTGYTEGQATQAGQDFKNKILSLK